MKKQVGKEKRKLFIEKRVLEGKSFDTIANELEVSKRTCVNWNIELEDEILELENIEKQKLIEVYKLSQKCRIEYLGELHQRLVKELNKRDFESLSIDKLIFFIEDVRNKMDLKINLKSDKKKLDCFLEKEISIYYEEDIK